MAFLNAAGRVRTRDHLAAADGGYGVGGAAAEGGGYTHGGAGEVGDLGHAAAEGGIAAHAARWIAALVVNVSFANGPSDSIEHGLAAAAYRCCGLLNGAAAVVLSFSNYYD